LSSLPLAPGSDSDSSNQLEKQTQVKYGGDDDDDDVKSTVEPMLERSVSTQC